MQLNDRFGAPVSHGDQADIDTLGDAAELMLAYAPDPVSMVKSLITKSPDFIMARCFLAGAYLVASDKSRQPLLRAEYFELLRLADRANDREKGHIRAIGLWLDGERYAASQAYADILNEFPRDIIALQYGHQTDFLLGHATSTRDRPMRVLNHWSEADSQYSFILGMQAFGLEEAGHYAVAQKMAERCVELNAGDSWGVHALAHCLEMQGKVEDGISFMLGCEEHWGHDSYMSIHNRWHLGLYYLEKCDFDQALTLHDAHMQVTSSSELMDMHDSAAMLWRLQLDNVDVGDRWQVVAENYAKVIDHAYMAFTDLHAMMSFAATGRHHEAQAQLNVLRAAAMGTSDTANAIGRAGLPFAEGFYAFGCGDYATAKRKLAYSRHNSHLIGGSVAQRDVINWTLIEAALRDGDTAMASAILTERTVTKPHSPLIDMFARKAA
ncbi:tetratricopeptide repeat protein [Rhodobacteraceae bacterium F11138]|nr:tetratricopeptide repeat protein [Rhodobacteraceae bacterium F11138]